MANRLALREGPLLLFGRALGRARRKEWRWLQRKRCLNQLVGGYSNMLLMRGPERLQENNPGWLGAALLLLGACWLVAHPHMGLWHDARLYAVDALARLNPGVFDRDLFLMNGSQGQFTVFPHIYAKLIGLAGLERATLILALAGKLLWLAALFLLARAMMPRPTLWLLGIVLVMGYPAFYDSHKLFSYGESFATPRIFAEAFTLLALAAWLRAYRLAALMLAVIAGVLHPLIALPGGALLTLMYFRSARTGFDTLAAFAIVAMGLASLFALGLYGRLFEVFDPDWFDVVVLRNPYVFLDQWNAVAFGRILFLCVVLGLMARESASRLQPLARAMLVATIALLAVSWVGGSVWKNVLLTQLQLWRVLWLAQILALLMLADLLPRLWKAGYPDRVLAACLAAAFLLDTWAAGAAALGGLLLRTLLLRADGRIDTQRGVWRALPWAIVLPCLFAHFASAPYWFAAKGSYPGVAAWGTLLGDRVGLIVILGMLYLARGKWGGRMPSLQIGVAAVLFLAAIFLWAEAGEHKTPGWQPVYQQLQKDIPPGSVVAAAMSGGVEVTWFELGRASYASQTQAVGALFDRNTALGAGRRLELLHEAGFPDSQVEWGAGRVQTNPLTQGAIMRLCQDPDLDFVLAGGAHAGAKLYFLNNRPVASLIACDDFRK